MTKRLISNERLEQICLIGRGSVTCRYITLGTDGFECAKGTSLAVTIDRRAWAMAAQGDNCKGLSHGNGA